MYDADRVATVNMAGKASLDLVGLHTHRNDWFVRHSRRLLQERFARGGDMTEPRRELHKLLESQLSTPKRLRALWTLRAIEGISDEQLIELLDSQDESLRFWAVQLLCEDKNPPASAMNRFLELATAGKSPLVRLALASSLQRLPHVRRWDLASALAARGEDASDQNLPLMNWYGIEPLIDNDPIRFAQLAFTSKIPRVRTNIARRAASSKHSEAALEILSQRIASARSSDEACVDVMTGMLEGLAGKRPPQPKSWAAAYARMESSKNTPARQLAVRVALLFNDPAAIESLRQTAENTSDLPDARRLAIESLANRRVREFDAVLIRLLKDLDVRSSAINALSRYKHPQTASSLLQVYPLLQDAEQQDALIVLASRPEWAQELLGAVARKQILASDITAYTARQIRQLGNDELSSQLTRMWGEIRTSAGDRQKRIAGMKKWLTTETIADADIRVGKGLFEKNCAACHKFFGRGGQIGPDITGAQRTNIDYLLENILDPSASVAKDYHMEVVQLIDGRVITGLVSPVGNQTIAIQTVNEKITVAVDDIELRRKSPVSIMPDGLLDALSEQQIRDLFGYLQHTP